ncbi:Uma2 family endonuclease [Pendulispora albinea]|uniref:Uma2 family endonuclease n=1 Tax=Pendulispora albinea TaxID=2741071 RepID=A0ABZ2MAU2_9BACT
MSQAVRPLRTTYAEFCEMELPGDRRYELIDGQIVAMNQASPRHARLMASLITCLETAFAGRCTVFGPMGVYCEETDEAFGPDIVVTCEPPRLDEVKGRAIVNPRAVVEILSPTTERVDRGIKLRAYETLASLQQYVLVSQTEKFVQVYRRGRDGWIWQYIESGTFEICEAAVSIDVLYKGIDDVPMVR